jgi:trimethylamine--corrinoid protein Co-methyltransferase
MDLSHGVAEQIGFSQEDIARMHQAALRTLREVGLAIDNAQALQAVADAGVRIERGRAFFEPAFVQEHLDAMLSPRRRRRPDPPPGEVTVTVGDMCQYYHSPYSDEIELMSTANVIEATKSVETMRDVGLGSYVPGVPRDVPHQLQAIVEYRIGCEFLTGSPTLDTLHPPEALPYLFEMAEAMGAPMDATNIFPVSPLRLSGYEFDVAVRHAPRWKRYSVTTYPAVGATAPIRTRAAWVLSIAEALGGAVTLHIASGGKPVSISIGMFPFDLRTFTIVGGMPECAWMYWARAQLTRFYHPDAGYSMILGSQAKRPGLQAGMEKAMAGALGVLTGCDDLHYVGVLSFDDIFSPEQMVADCELRDMLVQFGRGVPEEDPDRWIEEIREGIEAGYVQADTTLDHYRDTYWFPSLFDRTSWHTFASRQGQTARQRARQEVQSRLASYDYRPPAEIEEIRRIFTTAWQQFGGDRQSPVLRQLLNE